MKKAFAYLRLVRPANMVTAIGDVLAGVAIAGRFESGFDKTWVNILLLCLSTMFLYAGGAVYNDVFDADTDAFTHPERPIPSGAITAGQGKRFGFILLLIGIALAGAGSEPGGFIALGIVFFAIIYDKWGKHNLIMGPLYLGICRGLNLVLGISLVQFELQKWCLLGLVPIIYTYAVALIGRGGSSDRNRQNLQIGGLLYAAVIGAILYLANFYGELELTGIFLIAFALMIIIPLSSALQYPSSANIAKAARAGVRSLILMDAAWAITFESWIAAAMIVCLFFISLWLSKFFPIA